MLDFIYRSLITRLLCTITSFLIFLKLLEADPIDEHRVLCGGAAAII